MADPIATAADYADALMTSRKAKNVLFLILLLVLLIQLAIFFLARYEVLEIDAVGSVTRDIARVESGDEDTATEGAAPADGVAPTTLPEGVVPSPVVPEGARVVGAEPEPGAAMNASARTLAIYLVGLTAFLGVALAVVLALVILLVVKIMLIGRLIGVARLTSSYIWSLVLIVLLFPWQAFLDPFVFKIPGVLFTWEELTRDLSLFSTDQIGLVVLKWTRYVGAPVLAVIVLLVVQVKSRRGLRQALGEAGVDGDEIPPVE